MAETSKAAGEARALLESERHGVLSTLHAEQGGWPFGSVTPYALLPEGDPVLFLSDLAEHTRNVKADPRASLFVLDRATLDRPQTGARATLLGRVELATGAAERAAGDAYFGRFPASRAMSGAHDFGLYVLRVERVRWIAGFGSMGWISRERWRTPSAADPIAPHAKAIVDHMNADHPGALLDLAWLVAKAKGPSARMTGVDAMGLDVTVAAPGGGEPTEVRVPFPTAVSTPDEVRKAVMALVAQARKAPGRPSA